MYDSTCRANLGSSKGACLKVYLGHKLNRDWNKSVQHTTYNKKHGQNKTYNMEQKTWNMKNGTCHVTRIMHYVIRIPHTSNQVHIR